MRYDITISTAPKIQTLSKGTECIKLLLSQASEERYEQLGNMLSSIVSADVSGEKLMFRGHSRKVFCRMRRELEVKEG